jgi:hypothetical protein
LTLEFRPPTGISAIDVPTIVLIGLPEVYKLFAQKPLIDCPMVGTSAKSIIPRLGQTFAASIQLDGEKLLFSFQIFGATFALLQHAHRETLLWKGVVWKVAHLGNSPRAF